jgi:D-aspartate ligase
MAIDVQRMNEHGAEPGPRKGQALVLGDLDIAYPLRDQDVRVTLMRPREEPSRFSNCGVSWVEQPDAVLLPERLVETARGLPDPVVLYVAEDEVLQLVSHHRDALLPHLSFLMPEPDVVDALLDKGRFQELAAHHGLPIPPGEVVSTSEDVFAAKQLDLPVLIKPLVWKTERLKTDFGLGKAVVATTQLELRAILERVANSYERVLVQTFIPGDETRVESYHVYVNADGDILGEFTGRKIRTTPAAFGYSTAVMTTDEQDVIELGRRVVRAMGVLGVAKIDFKRDADGKLWVFEVNARFNLWVRLGAAAGVNLPALMFADVTGQPLPAVRRARPGMTWSRQPRDLLVARAAGVSLGDYLPWLRACDVISGFRIHDPMPFVRGSLPIQARAGLVRAREARELR